MSQKRLNEIIFIWLVDIKFEDGFGGEGPQLRGGGWGEDGRTIIEM